MSLNTDLEKKKKRLIDSFNKLKSLRVIKTQKDVSEKLGMSTNTVSQAINGNLKYLTDSFLVKFSTLSDEIDANWLLTGEEQPPKYKPFEHQKHEYEVITFDSFDQSHQQRYINEKARYGWELISVVQFTDTDKTPCFRFYFKRGV